MEPKDFKFDDDAFDDAPGMSDDFEDIYSDGGDKNSNKLNDRSDDGFEDFFTGKDADSEKDVYEDFVDSYVPVHSETQRPPVRKTPTNVEKKPYSYNYSKASQNKARRVTQDRVYDADAEIYSGKQPKGKKKKKVSGGKVFLIIVAILLVAVIAFGAWGYMYAKSLTEKVNYKPLDANKYVSSAELLRKDGVRNILLIGVDARDGESNDSTRSDTMMMITIDDNNKQIKMTSFLRDTYIDIPDYKWAKLNAAQSHGGTQLLVDTIEYNYKVDIDNYMLVNFDMFQTIIDTLGGIDVEVTEKEAKYINSRDHMTALEVSAFSEEIVAGPSVHFTGVQALWYSRIRYLDSDFMRTQRQRKVIKAIVDKAKQNPTSVIEIADKIMPMIETDLTSDEMMNIGINALKYMKYDMAQQQIPAEGAWSSGKRSGQSVLLIDLDKNKSILKTFVFEKATVESESETTTK